MGNILCATRGGPDSQRTQLAAIALALAKDAGLVFLYVVDASFLDNIAAPVVVDVEAELERMGRFQLTMAQEYAAEQGVEAQAEIRRGSLRDELIAVAHELGVTDIILGRPQGEDALFDDQALRLFARDLEANTGAGVRIV